MSHLKITKNDLLKTAEQGLISADQVTKLWDTLSAKSTEKKSSAMLYFLYYFGALLVISSMTWLMTLGWGWFSGAGLFLIALSYGIALFAGGYLLWKKQKFKIPGGLLVTAAICMTPLVIFGLEKYIGMWPSSDPGDYTGYYMWIKGSWLLMDIGVIFVGLTALKFVNFSFITAPIATAFWFLTMDITPLLFGELNFTWQQQCWVSFVFGLLLILCSFFVDKRSRHDFAFWGYLFGTLSFWGGLSVMSWTSELNWILYFSINMAMIVSAIFLKRNVLMIFGTLGVCSFLTHLAHQIFKNSMIFPFALSLIGLTIICLGILYQKNKFFLNTTISNLIHKKRT